MNSRQRKKKLKKSLFHNYETNGRKIYSYAVACGNLITIGFTAKPKQKRSRAYSLQYALWLIRYYNGIMTRR